MRWICFTLLPFLSHADSSSECYTGTITVGTETLTKDDILAWIFPQVVASVLAVTNADPELANFLKTRGNCQIQCLESVMKASAATLYGKLGEEFLSHEPHVQEIVIEAVTGAFRACYPFPPREEALKVAEAIVVGIGVHPPTDKTFPAGVACKNQGREDDFPLHEFLNAFEDTFGQVMATKPELHKFFISEAKDCQQKCLEETVPMSVMTLFLTDKHNDDVGVDAVTGAIHSCFPGVPEDDINQLVTDTTAVMLNAEQNALQRLQYDLNKPNIHYNPEGLEPGSSGFPIVSFITAVSLALCAGIGIGRQMRKAPYGGGYAYEMVGMSTIFGSRFD